MLHLWCKTPTKHAPASLRAFAMWSLLSAPESSFLKGFFGKSRFDGPGQETSANDSTDNSAP